MKTGRNIHVSKSPQMKRSYREYIGLQDYQPTVDERLDFNNTVQAGEDFSTNKDADKRRISITDRIQEHFANNWIGWIVCGVIIAIVYLVYDSKVAFVRFETVQETQNEKMTDLKNTISTLSQNDQSKALKIQQNKLNIEQVQKDVSQIENQIQSINAKARTK